MNSNRRNLLKATACLPFGFAAGSTFANPTFLPTAMAMASEQDAVQKNVFGDRPGYSPQIGLLVSMMDWMRSTIMYEVNGMSQKDLDYLHDEDSNTVGAMLMHLAATERFYQINTFDKTPWGEWAVEDDKKYTVAMELGQPARKNYKGNSISFYEDALAEVREQSMENLKKVDDAWINYTDEGWFWGPTNNWCKWFHVVEHESNHNGQIKWLKGRM